MTIVVQGAPQSGYGYTESNGISSLNAAETQSSQQVIFPETQAFEDQLPQETLQESADEESAVTTDDHHAIDHDHHHDHHLGLEWLREAVPGEPGVDYPIYWQVPKTSFNCRSLPAQGYYADIEAGCQVFHVCNEQGDKTFLCPNGTIFDQEHFTCQWWFNVDCGNSRQFYELNINIGAVAVETQDTVIFQEEDQVEQREQEFPLVPLEAEQEFPRFEEEQESVQQRNKYNVDEVLSPSLEEEQQTVFPSFSENKEIFEQENNQQPTETQLLYDKETVPVQDASIPPVQENVLEEREIVLENVVQEDDYVENETEAANIHHTTELTPAEQKTDDVSFQENITNSVQETINNIQQRTDEILTSQENNLTQNTDGTGSAYNPAQKESDINQVQQDDFVISEGDNVDIPVPQDTNFVLDPQQTNDVLDHQDAHNPQTQLDTATDHAVQEELDITTVQSVYSLIEEGIEDHSVSQETDDDSVQLQNGLISVEDTTDYYVPQETESLVSQETDQQEHDVDQTQQEAIYASEDSQEDEDSPVHRLYNHTTFSQDAASTPYQHQGDSPVQENFENILNQQEGGDIPLQQDSETDHNRFNQGTEQEILNTNSQQETSNTIEGENITISSAHDFTPSQQDAKYTPGVNEADNSSLQHETDYTSVLEDIDPISVQQEESHTPSYLDTGNTLVQQQNDQSVLQEDDSFTPVQEYEDTSALEVTDYTPLHHEDGFASVYPETNPNTAHQGPDYTTVSQENAQEKTGYVPVHQETDHTSVQQKPEHTGVQQDFDYTPDQEEIDHPSPLQGTVSDFAQQDPDYVANQQVIGEQQSGHVVLLDQGTDITSDQQHDSQGLISQETLFDTVQDQNEDVLSQQEISDIAVQQQPENAIGEKDYNAHSPVHQEILVNLAEGEITSFDQQTPEHFSIQQEHVFSDSQQEQSDIPFLEPGVVSIHQESHFDVPSQEPAYSPIKNSDFPSVPQEPVSSVQQESDYFPGVVPEISAVKPEQETHDLPESFPEVIPEAESSATVPEISLLYGVPVAHTTHQVLEVTTEHLLLPEYAADTTGNNESIAPGLLLIDPEDAVSAEISPVPSDFLNNSDFQEELGATGNLGQGTSHTQSTAFDEVQEKSYQDQPVNENAEVYSEQTEAETELPLNSDLFLTPENSENFGSGLISMVEDHTPALTSDENDYELAYNNQNNLQVVDSSLEQSDEETITEIPEESITEIPEESITEIPLYIGNGNTQHQLNGEAFDNIFSNIGDEQLTETESPELFITEVPRDTEQEVTTESLLNIRNDNLKLNETKNENLFDEEEISQVTQTKENHVSSVEIPVNNDGNEADDINTIPIVRLFPKSHEDPVLSLFFKEQAVELSNNEETITGLPREEFNSAYDSNEESAVSPTDDQNQLVLGTEDAIVVPGIQEYSVLPVVLQDKVKELHAPDTKEENEEVGISQVTDAEDQLIPLLHEKFEKNTETNTILQTQEVPYSEGTNAQPLIPYAAPEHPLDHLPQISSSYLPPRVA